MTSLWEVYIYITQNWFEQETKNDTCWKIPWPKYVPKIIFATQQKLKPRRFGVKDRRHQENVLFDKKCYQVPLIVARLNTGEREVYYYWSQRRKIGQAAVEWVGRSGRAVGGNGYRSESWLAQPSRVGKNER